MITGAYRFDQHKGIKSAKTTVDWKIRSKTFKAEHHACIILPQSNRLQRELLNQYWCNKCNQRVTSAATCDWSAHHSEVVQQHVCVCCAHCASHHSNTSTYSVGPTPKGVAACAEMPHMASTSVRPLLVQGVQCTYPPLIVRPPNLIVPLAAQSTQS